MHRSAQTLSEQDRRLLAGWAADCAERVLWLFEAERPDDDRPRAAIERGRAYCRGELDTASEIRRRFVGSGAARDAGTPAAIAAARAAGQTAVVSHMGAHALGAAGYAVKAAMLAQPDDADVFAREIGWQLEQMSRDVQRALSELPLLGADRSGPLGPGLLASGQVGAAIRALQARLG